MRVPVVLPPYQNLVPSGFFFFFTLAILISMQCYHNMVFIYIFLVANDVEHLLYAHLPLISSLVKCVFKSFTHLKNGLFLFLVLSFKMLSLLDISFCQICDS